MQFRHSLQLAMLILSLAGCGKERKNTVSMPNDFAADPLVILAAASTKDAVEELAVEFERQAGTRVRVSAGPSNALARQIVSGAATDLFLSANEEWAEHVAEQGLAEATAPLLTNQLVLIVPRDNPANIQSAADLAGSRVKRVALAGESVPAGMYAEQALRALGLYGPLMDDKKVVRGQDVRTTLGYVERGEVDAGIVYSTDAKIAKQVAILSEFDLKSYDPIVYPLVLVKRDRPNPTARRLFEFLRSPDAAAVFKQFGFERIAEK
jgi:molybdate transport system substrate-binding protein